MSPIGDTDMALAGIDPPDDQPERHPNARADLGHDAILPQVKLHPDLHAFARRKAAARYQSLAEYVRQLIVADMEDDELDRLRSFVVRAVDGDASTLADATGRDR